MDIFVVQNDLHRLFGWIREKDGFHPFVDVTEELENAYYNRMKRIEANTRLEKIEQLTNEYLAFERKMMYIIAMATIQKAKEWNEPIRFLYRHDLDNRMKSMQEQLLKSLEAKSKKYKAPGFIIIEIPEEPKELEEADGDGTFDYNDILIISRRLNKKINKNAPFVPWEYDDEYSGITDMEEMVKRYKNIEA